MKAELDVLIQYFRDAQDIGVATIRDVLQMPLPKSGLDWVQYCCNHGIQRLKELNGVPIYAHGFGIELTLGELTIDFDWGPNGEPDGFDAWRLYNFTLTNATGVECSHNDVIQWIDAAFENGELHQVGGTYFDPRRRADANRKPTTDGRRD
ncbi:MAG: hypothetical protein KDB14_12235 [Planctomycetales bacterium]|nr:hypothetical protein [Planctomycetales bacterium]